MRMRYSGLGLLGGLLLVLALALVACGSAGEREAGGAEPVYLNLGPEATYVGPETCGTCHPSQYASFAGAEMGRSFRRASLANSDADFDAPTPVYDPVADLYYQPFHRGQRLFVREYRLAGRDTVHQRVEPIDYIVGSGQHTNSHIRDVNGYLYQIPVTWYAQAGRWGLAPGFASGNSRFSRPIPLACMACHNAVADYEPGSENRFTRVPEGIDCERCHGPGSVHVREKQAGRMADVIGGVDYTIVNPAKLPPDLQLNVCERCHAQGAAVFAEGRSPYDFRPGMRLAEVEDVFLPRYTDSTAHFIMASHPDRLRMSACFRGTREAGSAFAPMTCITCHDPHVSIRAQGRAPFNRGCQSCHDPERPAAAPACTEPAVVRAGGQGDCVACHMPVTAPTDIPNVRVTDHFIRRPDGVRAPEAVLTQAEVRARSTFVRLASLIARAPSERAVAEGYLTYYEELSNHPGFLDSAAVHLARAQRAEPVERLAPSLVRLHFLREDYAAVTRLAAGVDAGRIEDAWTLYRIGESFAKQGAYAEAVRYLQRAVDRAPGHLRFRHRLASATANAGQLERALVLYDALLRANPGYADAYNDRGYTHLRAGALGPAEADFRRALALDPDAEVAMANLASLLYNTARPDEARPLVRRLLVLSPEHPGYRQLWDLLN